MNAPNSSIACIGLRARTARAVVVVAADPATARAVMRADLVFATMARPELFQPYHAVMDLPWGEAVAAAREAERAIEAAATRSLRAFLDDVGREGLEVRSVGIVGAPERNLGAMGSPHIRAHAAEGVLFRRVWEGAAQAMGLASQLFPEKGLEAFAAARLGLSPAALQSRLAEFGRVLGRPWRADEKAAAIAAWMGLSSRRDA